MMFIMVETMMTYFFCRKDTDSWVEEILIMFLQT